MGAVNLQKRITLYNNLLHVLMIRVIWDDTILKGHVALPVLLKAYHHFLLFICCDFVAISLQVLS